MDLDARMDQLKRSIGAKGGASAADLNQASAVFMDAQAAGRYDIANEVKRLLRK